jgi:hypothetical protein
MILTRHEHLVLVILVRVCEDVGALESLRKMSKNVEYDQQCRLSVFGAGGVCLHAIYGDPFALLFVALAHNWWDSAASLGLRRHGCEYSATVDLGWMFETCSEKVVYSRWSG